MIESLTYLHNEEYIVWYACQRKHLEYICIADDHAKNHESLYRQSSSDLVQKSYTKIYSDCKFINCMINKDGATLF